MNIESLIPHRAPARLVERVVRATATEAVCVGRIAEAGPWDDQGVAPVIVGIELAAQTAAVFQALLGASSDPMTPSRPVGGYLTTIRDACFHRPSLPVGGELVASIRATGGFRQLFLCEVEVHIEATGELAITATVGTVTAS